ncbi:hypothetical protein B5807_00744 [Epicoccum nigrum]|jgi:hypothetical protein|uniref:Uncharacterized protein n=1 Tax=Epicoccum nigrum TaxID=105696 RepID=A0A1Y2MDF4_EPING|nr:hypothetical protein B5807_00744 [Epicoccum nigrum]
MPASIDTKALRSLALDQLPAELSTLRSESTDDTITEQLLGAIEHGLIPTSIFAVWLGICKSPLAVRQALKQRISVKVRFLGIAQLKHSLQSAQWEEFWDGLGGSAGLLDLLGDLSVREVRSACKAIGRVATEGDVLRKRQRVTELFKGFYPNIFPEAVAKTHDSRPLTKFYEELVPACTTELVEWITSQEQDGKWRFVRENKLLKYHADSVGRAAIRSVFEGRSSSGKYKDRLEKISTGRPAQLFLSETPPTEERFSSSMTFALQLLRHVVETKSTQLEDSWVLKNLIQPLLKRAMSKRVSWPSTQNIATLATEFLRQQPSAARALTGNRHDLLHLVGICWSRRSTLFEPQLKQLVKAVFDEKPTFETLGNLLIGVPRSRRYALLRLFCKETMYVDLESGTNLSETRGRLSADLLSALQAPDAMKLFKCLRDTRGDAELVDLGFYTSVLVTTRTPDVYEGDPDIYYLVLLNRNGMYEEAEAYASKIMEVRKKNTQTASNRERRAEYALSAWACASASGSLALLSETVQWARRFVRDQLTAARLFSNCYDEMIQLLSGFRKHTTTLPKLDELRGRVKTANKIMLDLLEIACSAVREPHFRVGDWRLILDLFNQVIKERLCFLANLQDASEVSDRDLYHAMWSDTIPILLQVEITLLDEEFEKLGEGNICGILDWESILPDDLTSWRKHAWDFVDNLAKARDQMWMKLRAARYPDVLTLPEPFPRGLPVQNLFSLRYSTQAIPVDLHGLTPYIFAQVKNVLFISPKTALEPVVKDTMGQAIGPFVDNYEHALKLYISVACNKKEKERRFAEVWEHLVGPLSKGRMTREEATDYWYPFVPHDMRNFKLLPDETPIHWPLLPRPDDPLQYQEWNPLDGRPVDDVTRKARDLGRATYLDFCTFGIQSQQSSRPTFSSRIKAPKPRLPEKKRYGGSIWNYAQGPEAKEANALSALLYLDAKYGSKEGLLSTPFPSADDIRFPCVYLDEDFLSRDELKVHTALRQAYSESAPLLLIHKVAMAVVERLFSSKSSPTLEGASLELVRALKDSDRPSLAFDLALRVIISQPTASSWHRVLFNDGFLNSLPASEAKRCIEKYAEAIGQRLNAMKESKVQAEADNEADTQVLEESGARKEDQPFIKITTLKSLAQLLNNSAYIGEDVSLKILSDLSQAVSHIDVRVSILKTFLSKLDSNRPELWDVVCSALAGFLPIVGSMNEREPTKSVPREPANADNNFLESHKMIEQGQRELPKLVLTIQLLWEDNSPMAGAINEHLRRIYDPRLLKIYLERIVLPLLKAFEDQTARWTTMFLRKYAKENSELLNLYVPPVPKGIAIWSVILTKMDQCPVPQTLLDKYVTYVLFKIEPPVPVRDFNQSLYKSALRNHPEVETWLDLYGNETGRYWSKLLPPRQAVFEPEENMGLQSHITAQSYREAFLKVFKALILADSPNYTRLTEFVSLVDVTEDCKLINEEMIAHVSSLRTREWERDPKRSPAVLPDVFPWRLLLLTYPREDGSDGEPECKAFAKQIATLVDEISGGVYHEKLEKLKEQTKYTSRRGKVLTALFLGDISKTRLSWLTTSDIIRVDVAAYLLLESGHVHVKSHEDRVKALLNSWTESENEEVRRTGYKVSEALSD